MEFAMTGASPISTETLEYFGQLGIQINEVSLSLCLVPLLYQALQNTLHHITPSPPLP